MEEDSSSVPKAQTASPILGAFQVDENGNVKMSGEAYIKSVDQEARRLLRRGHPSELELNSISSTGRVNSYLINLLGVTIGGAITILATLFGATHTSEETAVMGAFLGFFVLAAIGLAIALISSDSALKQMKEEVKTKSDIDKMDRILPKDLHETIVSPSADQKTDQG